MMRVLRKCPELLRLLKGIGAGVRSVYSTICLLVIFMYVFAIVFMQQSANNEALQEYFGTIGLSFTSLLMHGALVDNISEVFNVILDASPFLAALLLIFILFAHFTILNLLIGVLCEVIAAVSVHEKTEMTVQYAKDNLLGVLKVSDIDNS